MPFLLFRYYVNFIDADDKLRTNEYFAILKTKMNDMVETGLTITPAITFLDPQPNSFTIPAGGYPKHHFLKKYNGRKLVRLNNMLLDNAGPVLDDDVLSFPGYLQRLFNGEACGLPEGIVGGAIFEGSLTISFQDNTQLPVLHIPLQL